MGSDVDEQVTYPDEKLYAEEYKREAVDLDERVTYPDEKLYAEEYKRCISPISWMT
jgi:hypothetical protein